MKSRLGLYAIITVFAAGYLVESLADDAAVLPKGVSRVRIESNFYQTVDRRFDDNGNSEDVATDYNTNLDSSVFENLSAVEGFFNLPEGSASLGDSVVDFEYDFQIYNFWFERGLTDKLSVGVKVPYWRVKNNVDASVDNTDATVGKNPLFTGAPCAPGTPVPDPALCLTPVVPLPLGQPMTTEDVQDLLGKGLDVNGDGNVDVDGFGYERVEDYSNNHLADMEVGFRYQYLNNPSWRLAFTGGVRLPTGKKDDPDNLVDFPTGDNTYDILLRLNNDYVGFDDLWINVTLGYDIQLPKDETLRVLESVDRPVSANKEKVDRDLGDIFIFDTKAQYDFTDAWSGSLRYRHTRKAKDDVSGDMGFDYSALEDETNRRSHEAFVRLSYNTFSQFQNKKFPLPLDASIVYRNRFKGRNRSLKSQYWGLRLVAYF